MKINKAIIKNLKLIVLIVIVLNLGMAFAADPPTTINFQGYLTNSASAAIDETKDIKIGIYEAETGGSATYEETHSSVTIDNGRFSVSIGGGTVSTGTWPTNADFSKALWIEITIDPIGDNETLSSRIPLTPAPYAKIAVNDSLYAVEKDGCNSSQYVKRNSSDNGWECADLDVTLTGTETLTNKTLTTPVITLEQAADVSGKTEEGKISWDSDDDKLFVGTGSSVVEIGAGGASSLSGLSDVGTATATSGNILVADGSGWESVAVSGDATITSSGTLTISNNSVDGTDITLGSDAQGDIMYYDGTDWARLAAGTAGQLLKTQGGGQNPTWTTSQLTDLSDVGTAGTTSGNILIADGSDWDSVAVSGDATIASDGELTVAINTSKVRENLSSISSSTTLDSSHVGVILASGTITLTLPTIPANGDKYTIKNIDSNTITINPNGKNIDGSGANISLTNQYDYVTLVYNGTAWFKVAASSSGDDLGDHTADSNVQLGAHYLSNDGGNEGISIDTSGNVTASGSLTIGAYTLPSTDGTENQILKTDGSGSVTWQADNSGSGGGSYTTYSAPGTGQVSVECGSGTPVMGGCVSSSPKECSASSSYPSTDNSGTVVSGSTPPTGWTCYFADTYNTTDGDGTAYVVCQ